jgi:hypothetical protein
MKGKVVFWEFGFISLFPIPKEPYAIIISEKKAGKFRSARVGESELAVRRG